MREWRVQPWHWWSRYIPRCRGTYRIAVFGRHRTTADLERLVGNPFQQEEHS